MWNRHSKLQASGKITLIEFIKARSLSLTITLGYTFAPVLKNNPHSFSKVLMKLFSRSVNNKTKAK